MKSQVLSTLLCLALISGCGWINSPMDDSSSNSSNSSAHLEAMKFVDGVSYFNSCSDIQNKVKSILEKKKSHDRKELAYYKRQRTKYQSIQDEPYNDNSNVPTAENSPTPNNSAGAKETSARSNPDNIQTNLQESAVDESDFIKANSHHVFSLDDNEIQVVDRSSLKYLGELATGSLDNIQLFTDENRLIVIGSRAKRRTICAKSEANERRCKSISDAETQVQVYRSTKGAMPKKIHKYSLLGTYSEARMIGSDLILVSKDDIQVALGKPHGDPFDRESEDDTAPSDPTNFSRISRRMTPPSTIVRILSTSEWTALPNLASHKIPSAPVGIDEDGKAIWGVPCSAIVKPPIDDLDFSITKISRFDTTNPDAKILSTASLGSGEIVYATDKSIYTTKQGVRWLPWQEPTKHPNSIQELSKRQQHVQDQLAVYKIDLSQRSNLRFVAAAVLDGRLKDRWALKELDQGKHLVAATTTGILNGGEGVEARNHLFMLRHVGKKLEQVSAIRDFGENEDIRAIRYINDTAFVVTFRQTDPLFAFDLSERTDINLLGELKIPGFSTYLHPYSDRRMIGIGFDANENNRTATATYTGIQVSLFDIEDPTNLERLDSKVHGGRGSHSEVTANARALYFDQESKLFALPVVEVSPRVNDALFEGWQGPINNRRSGAIFYTIKNDKLKAAGWASHSELIPTSCRALLSSNSSWQTENRSVDVNRIFKLDGRILSISRWALKEHKISNNGVQVLGTTRFVEKSNSEACRNFTSVPLPND